MGTLIIETKENSPEKLAAIVGKETKYFLMAEEFNDVVAAINDKEDASQKGVADGYAPLNEFVKLSSDYLNIVNDLVTGGSTALASAETVKTLKTQINTINTLLTSDNINLDTIQEIVDAIENVQSWINTILVNDLTTGGTTKALTAEMGKTLKILCDSISAKIPKDYSKVVYVNANTPTTATIFDTNNPPATNDNSLKEDVNNLYIGLDTSSWVYNATTLTYDAETITSKASAFYLYGTNKDAGNNKNVEIERPGAVGVGTATKPNHAVTKAQHDTKGDMTTNTAQPVSALKTFLNGMFGLRNSANTFTNLFSVITTAARTWTWPDKSGTVAMISDIPSTGYISGGVVNFLSKYLTATTVGASRIKDDGTFVGIGSQSPVALTKHVQLGRDTNKEIGVEQSPSSIIGRDLVVTAGRTINFAETADFIATNQTLRQYIGATFAPNGDFYTATYSVGGDIYKQTAGTSILTPLSTGLTNCRDMCSDSSGNIYAIVFGGNLYKQTGGTGSFVSQAQTVRNWWGLCITPSGVMYASVNGGDIYIMSGGVFTPLGQTNRNWKSMCAAPNGDVYCVVQGGDIYKQTAGAGNFLPLGQTSREWTGMCATQSGNIYACVGTGAGGDIYKQTAGTGNFLPLGQTTRFYYGMCAKSNGDVYVTTAGTANTGDIYVQLNDALGIADLNGGALKLKAGTGKGTGQSRAQIITGTKTASGTDMQIEQVVIECDENGKSTFNGVIKLKGYTVTTLPTGAEGDTAYVIDATSPTFLSTVVGGGSVKCRVFFNGTNWIVN